MTRTFEDEYGFAYAYEVPDPTPATSLWWWRVRLMAAGLRQAVAKRLQGASQ